MKPGTGDSDPLVREVWDSVKHGAMKRAAALEHAVLAYRDTGDDNHRLVAVQEAHRLAGALGCFGYAELSAAAARVENALDYAGPEAVQVAAAAEESGRLRSAVAAAARRP